VINVAAAVENDRIDALSMARLAVIFLIAAADINAVLTHPLLQHRETTPQHGTLNRRHLRIDVRVASKDAKTRTSLGAADGLSISDSQPNLLAPLATAHYLQPFRLSSESLAV
jgi:hypothetical protein